MKAKAVAVWLILFFSLVSSSPTLRAEEKETKKEDDQQILILLPGQTEAERTDGGSFFRLTGVGMFAASGGDLVTTEWGLQRPGIYEGNPIASNRGVRIATHVVAPAVVWWTTEKMQKSGHKKLALIIRIGLMAAYSYAAMHNVHTVNGQ
jgi:hypothetical protein